ncbi:hypothetical protein HN51_022459 [Arachis hypogaea]
MSGKLNAKSALHSLGVVLQKLLADHALSSGQQSLFFREDDSNDHDNSDDYLDEYE